MKPLPALRDTLLKLTIDLAAEVGVERLSLRQIATAAGVSTTAIFQNFEGKADLLAAALDQAISLDDALHDQLRDEVFPLVSSHLGLADAIATYVQMRAPRREARFVSEVLVKLHDHPQCLGALAAWHDGRIAFWQDLLDRLQAPSSLAVIIARYVLMEGIYAHAMLPLGEYRMLLFETCRALCDAAMNGGGSAELGSNVSAALGTVPFAVRGPALPGASQPVAEQLLDTAVEIINESGMRTLNQRALAARAGVSGSLIAYHFGDMKTLAIQAIWRALVQGIPTQLDPAGDSSTLPKSLEEWLRILDAMLEVGNDTASGFYIGVSQLSAEACLLATRNPELMPLIRYLRSLEGWGTYRVSRSIPGVAPHIRRDHATAFGVWIKAEALLRNAGISHAGKGPHGVQEAAAMIFPTMKASP
ncbi:MAG: hypothetical protein RIS94_1215 [Pseudomonadota bacterium]|jgi:AcrR family transcriptional regulator